MKSYILLENSENRFETLLLDIRFSAGSLFHGSEMPATASSSDIQAFAMFAEFVAKEAGEVSRGAHIT